MSKANGTEDAGIKPPVETVSTQKPPNVDTKKIKEVSITFKGTRKFDLHVGREMKTFKGRETKKIPADWLNHPDFTQVKKYFIVKGV